MREPWIRPSQVTRWEIITQYEYKSFPLRRKMFAAYATGYKSVDGYFGEVHVRYGPIYAKSREDAELRIRSIICQAVSSRKEWEAERDLTKTSFDAKDVCP